MSSKELARTNSEAVFPIAAVMAPGRLADDCPVAIQDRPLLVVRGQPGHFCFVTFQKRHLKYRQFKENKTNYKEINNK